MVELTGLRGLDAWLDARIGGLLPGWRITDQYLNALHLLHEDGRGVIISGDREQDGNRWIHFSMSYANRIPTWTELVRCKEELLGEETMAIQVIPPRSKYVNKNPYVLHFFIPVGHDPLPDFTRGRGVI